MATETTRIDYTLLKELLNDRGVSMRRANKALGMSVAYLQMQRVAVDKLQELCDMYDLDYFDIAIADEVEEVKPKGNYGTLEEFIKNNQGLKIKLGTAKGGGYFYCGEINKGTLKEIKKIEESYIKQAKRMIKYHKTMLGRINHTFQLKGSLPTDTVNEVRERLENDDDVLVTEEEFKKIKTAMFRSVDKLINELKSACNGINNKRKYLEEVTPFKTRQIMEVYDSFEFENIEVKNVIIQGTEHGSFWLFNEYLDGVDRGLYDED